MALEGSNWRTHHRNFIVTGAKSRTTHLRAERKASRNRSVSLSVTSTAPQSLLSPSYARASASIDKMPTAYEIRAGGDVKNKKQSMADLKLRRLNELNSRLREDLERPRIKVSEASMS